MLQDGKTSDLRDGYQGLSGRKILLILFLSSLVLCGVSPLLLSGEEMIGFLIETQTNQKAIVGLHLSKYPFNVAFILLYNN